MPSDVCWMKRASPPVNWYDADIARGDGEGELERIIKQTVITESATIFPAGEEPETRDAVVTIKEGQTGSIMLGAGVASDSGVIGQISLDQRNFDYQGYAGKLGLNCLPARLSAVPASASVFR